MITEMLDHSKVSRGSKFVSISTLKITVKGVTKILGKMVFGKSLYAAQCTTKLKYIMSYSKGA